MTAILIVVAYTSYKIGLLEGRVKGLSDAKRIINKAFDDEDKKL